MTDSPKLSGDGPKTADGTKLISNFGHGQQYIVVDREDVAKAQKIISDGRMTTPQGQRSGLPPLKFESGIVNGQTQHLAAIKADPKNPLTSEHLMQLREKGVAGILVTGDGTRAQAYKVDKPYFHIAEEVQTARSDNAKKPYSAYAPPTTEPEAHAAPKANSVGTKAVRAMGVLGLAGAAVAAGYKYFSAGPSMK